MVIASLNCENISVSAFLCSREKFSVQTKQLQNSPKTDINLRPFAHQTFCEHPKVSAGK
ncbi:MAG: hypothetical protein IKC65_04655 [Lentisphaeria bacterium]|nr:hypothetical protein [Lentisphaeria bacterium]